MVKMEMVEGEHKAKISLYTLSTCGWCAKTRKFFSDHGLAYSYIDVDLLPPGQAKEVRGELLQWNPRGSFPTIVINDKVIVGFDPKKILEAIG